MQYSLHPAASTSHVHPARPRARQILLLDDIKDRPGHAHADWISAQRASVLAGTKQRGDFRFGEHGTHRQSAADRFAQGHDVRLNDSTVGAGEMLMAEPFSGSPAAGPDFVEDQREPALVTKVS